MKWKKEAKVLFLKAVPGTALPDVLVRQLKEFKDIDCLVIAFFASTLKIVSSLFHTQPCLQGDKFSDHDWVMILIRIIKGYLYSNGVGRSHGESSSGHVGWQESWKPSPSRGARVPELTLQRHLMYFKCHFIALCIRIPKFFGAVHCMDLFFFTPLYLSPFSCCAVHKSCLSDLVQQKTC